MRPSHHGPTLLLLITAVVILVFALVSRVTSGPANVPSTATAVAAAPLPIPASPEASPAAATVAPTETPTATPELARTGSPLPTPTATPTPAASPTPRPTATASPTAAVPITIANAIGPVPAGSTRYQGIVTDATTGAPLPGVCVYAGPPAGCPVPGLLTDAAGHFAEDFPAGLGFTFTFEKEGYLPAIRQTGTTINLALLRR